MSMKDMTEKVKDKREVEKTGRVTNFMGGNSYEINPLETMKMITASSIFGEPSYYRDGEFDSAKIKDGSYAIHRQFADYSVIDNDKFKGMKTSEIMEKVIDDALEYDFAGTIEWAKELRKNFYMRLNPQVIMVRAAMHPKRQEYTDQNPGAFASAQMEVMSRGDDVIAQFTYYLFRTGSKKNLPNILKRTWAKKVSSLSRYALSKYFDHGLGLIDVIRISHATGADISELMKNGELKMDEQDRTWESLRVSGEKWSSVLSKIRMNHAALLRNLRGIFTEIEDLEKCKELMVQLQEGVEKGKQFPFRYMSAYNAVNRDSNVNHKPKILEGLEECLDVACANLPQLPGKNAFLSDNSGSAWGTFNSEYGSVTVAQIGNLSSVIGAANSDEGYVFTFGDKLKEFPITKREGILAQANKISSRHGNDVGHGTENGIWLFLEKAITEKVWWDNIFIYSDMQAGHGGLYGKKEDMKNCRDWECNIDSSVYIDVNKLIDRYRKTVNPKVNVYCIQTAGYSNVLVPEYGYRNNILYGWTGKELVYADTMNKFWDEKDRQKAQAKDQTSEDQQD